MTHGTYHYNTTAQNFTPTFTLAAGENYNLTQATVNSQCPTTFAARLLGISAVQRYRGSAIAAHRPRDVAVVLDYSGSMNNESDLWNNEAYLDNGQSAPNNTNYTSNNVETIYPLFGHYAGSTTAVTPTVSTANNYSDYTNYANLLCPSADGGEPAHGQRGDRQVERHASRRSASRRWSATSGRTFPRRVRRRGPSPRSPTAATSMPTTNRSTRPTPRSAATNISKIKQQRGQQPYAITDSQGRHRKHIEEQRVGSLPDATATSPSPGTTSFTGYIQGPRYWGKTSSSSGLRSPTRQTTTRRPALLRRWRRHFQRLDVRPLPTPFDNTRNLWDNSGNWLDPPGNYTINYKAILNFIKNVGPNPFPPQLRSGNTIFYSSIPTDVLGLLVLRPHPVPNNK